MAIVVGVVLQCLLLAAGIWVGYQLVRQNGRILLRLESIQQQIGQNTGPGQPETSGLPIGRLAPDFELPDLAGNFRKLSDFRGQDTLLVFFNPSCGFCTQMADDLAAMSLEAGTGRPILIVITTGSAEENRHLVEQYGLRCVVLIQEQMEVAARFGAQGTPMGYRIDASGRIASELAVGAEALLRLSAQAADSARLGKETGPKPPDPSLSRSRINRSGLKAGAVAPDFRLPRLEGGELALADLRGGRVLLVFSDPECGPCDDLAPRLQQLHLKRRDLQIVVVSRRDAEASRAKASSLGLTYPIVMQQQWEISLKYEMFATPIGYLIDDRGIVVDDVAVGMEPILALAAAAAVRPAAEGEPVIDRRKLATTV
jgi:peroxiredoxin